MVIESRPLFWNVLFFGIEHAQSIREALRWLQRSGTTELHIRMFDDLTDAPIGSDHSDAITIMQSLSQVLPRIRSLHLTNPNSELCRLFWPGSMSVPTPARSQTPVTLLYLSSLSLRLYGGTHTKWQLVQALNQTPQLQVLSVDGFFKIDGITSGIASLPHLRQLSLLRCPRSFFDLLRFPAKTTVHVRLLPTHFPPKNQHTRNGIIAEFVPASFSQSLAINFVVAGARYSPAPRLDIWHRDTPTGRRSSIRLILNPEFPIAELKASLQLATEVFKDLESVEVVHLKVGFGVIPISLVEWIMGFPNLRILELTGTHASQVLGDPLFTAIRQHPRLLALAVSEDSCFEVAGTRLQNLLADRAHEPCPVKLEFFH